MTDIVQPDPRRCPMCGKLHAIKRNVYEYPRIGGKITKVKTGEKEAVHKYLPFCTLRCGWQYGIHHWKKGRKAK